MQLKSAELQEQINSLDLAIQQGSTDAQLNLWEMKKKELQDQLQAALENEQAHESRVQEATAESSKFLDDIYIADVPVAESGLSELAFNILNSKVTEKHVAAIGKLSLAMNEQQVTFQQELKAAIDRATTAENSIEQYQTANKDLEVANYQLGLEKDELDDKARKGAELLFEATETIDKLNKQIDEYKKAELLAPQPTVTLTTSEQVAQQEAELKASRIKVTSMTADPDDFAKRTWFIVLALTGEKKAINYLEKGNYTLVDEATAEQLRADEANKKAELEAQQASIPTLEVPEINPVNPVTETVEAAESQPFQEEVQATDNGDLQGDQGNESLHEVVSEESEVDRAPVTKAEFEARVTNVEKGMEMLMRKVFGEVAA